MFPKITLKSFAESRDRESSTEQKKQFPIVPPRSESVLISNLPVVNEETPTWFVVLSPREERGPAGPFSINQLKQFYKREEISDRTLVWRDGEKEWKSLVQQGYLRAQMVALPKLPPRVHNYSSEMTLFQPYTKVELPENTEFIPLPEKDHGIRACNVCGGVAMLHSKNTVNNAFENISALLKQDEVGSNEFTTEILPGFLWIGSLNAAKPVSVSNLGITLLINVSGYTGLIKSHPPYFRVKELSSLREGFTEFNQKQQMEHLELLEKVYDYIEHERLYSERNHSSDLAAVARGRGNKTDQYGLPLRDDKPFRRPDPEMGAFFAPRVLIYSKQGSNRSCFLVAAYLIKRYGMTVNSALTFIKGLRGIMEIEQGFISLLHIWAKKYALGFLICVDCAKMVMRDPQQNNNNNNNEESQKPIIEISPEGVIHLRPRRTVEKLDAPDAPSQLASSALDIDHSLKELSEILANMHSNPVNKIKEEQKKDLFKIISVQSFITKWTINAFFDSPYSGLMDLNLSSQNLSDATISVLLQLMENLSLLHQIRMMDLSHNQIKSLSIRSLLLAFYAKVNYDPDHDNYLEDENLYNKKNNQMKEKYENDNDEDDDGSESDDGMDIARIPNLISLDLSNNW
jgi:hypothetical protein